MTLTGVGFSFLDNSIEALPKLGVCESYKQLSLVYLDDYADFVITQLTRLFESASSTR